VTGDPSIRRFTRIGRGAQAGVAGQMLVIYHPEPGTSNADKLALRVLRLAGART